MLLYRANNYYNILVRLLTAMSGLFPCTPSPLNWSVLSKAANWNPSTTRETRTNTFSAVSTFTHSTNRTSECHRVNIHSVFGVCLRAPRSYANINKNNSYSWEPTKLATQRVIGYMVHDPRGLFVFNLYIFISIPIELI